MAERVLIDTGMSARGWSYYGNFVRCPHLFALTRLAGLQDTSDALVKGTMGHVTQAHLHARWMAQQSGQDPNVYYTPEDALWEWVMHHPEGRPFHPLMLEVFRRYVARYPEPPGRILGVEHLVRGVVGFKGGAFGLWTLADADPFDLSWRAPGPPPRHISGVEIMPVCVTVPGSPIDGEPIMVTKRIDLTVQDKAGLVYPWDHKCLPRGARVADVDTGGTRLVGSIMGPWTCVAWNSERAALVAAPAKRAEYVGFRPVVRVDLAHGRSAHLGADHPVLTRQGWVDAGQLTEDDYVAVAIDMPMTGRSWGFEPHDVTALGLYMCDGSSADAEGVQFSKVDRRVVAEFRRALTAGRTVTTECDTTKARASQGRLVRARSDSPFAAQLRKLGLWRVKSADRVLPVSLTMVNRPLAMILVGALWSGDGAAYIVAEGRKRKVRIVYSCRSEKLAEQVQDLLLSLGYPCTLTRSSVAYKGRRVPTFTTTLVGTETKRRFLQAIQAGGIPCETVRDGGERTRRGRLCPSAAEMLAVLPEAPPRCRYSIDVEGSRWWVKVERVTPTMPEPVYNIEVPGDHTFVAEGLITHNCTSADISPKRAAKYAMDEQFAITRILTSQYYGSRFGHAVLNLIEVDDPWRVARPTVPATPYRDTLVAHFMHYRANAIAQLMRDYPNPHHWPMADHELTCSGRYGDCSFGITKTKVCSHGPLAQEG